MEVKQNSNNNSESLVFVSIPDTQKTIDVLDRIYEVVERMNPELKELTELTELTELLTEFKHSVEVSAFSYGLKMGLDMQGESPEPNLKA